jgi:NAD(P)-dependent dehydrogenase (short-subunit alcohol dehydrogenase family)
VALVTGASQGIGAAIASRLDAEGCRLVLIARNAERLAGVANSFVGPFAAEAMPITCDVMDPNAIIAAVGQAIGRFGGIDILVNNAGGPSTGGLDPFDTLTDDDFLATYTLNTLSAVRFARAVLPGMRQRRWGRIVSISSESGVQPDPIGADYNAAKAALNAFSKSLAKAYAGDGVLANVVSPAFTLTQALHGFIAQQAQAQGKTTDEMQAAMLSGFRPNIGLGRAGRADETASAVAFLASELASFINGANLRVDGGSVASVAN